VSASALVAQPRATGAAAAQTFTVTFFTSYAASSKREGAHTLASLARLVRATDAAKKADLPWLKLARFGDARTNKGSLRHDANMLTISGIEADYDGGATSFAEAEEKLIKAGLMALLYTSPSYTEDAPRWRVICPTSKELAPDRREHLVGRLNGLFSGAFAAESWTRSQSYYFGSVGGNPSHKAEAIDGEPIDTLDELDEIWIGKPDTAPSAKAGSTKNSGTADEVALLSEITGGTSYHTAAVRLLGKWALDNVPLMEARARLIAAFDGVFPPDRDARWKARRDDVDRCLLDIYGKEAKSRDEPSAEKRSRRTKPIATTTDGEAPTIRVVAGELHKTTTAAEGALLESDFPIFQRGSGLVRPVVQDVPAARGRMTVSAALHEMDGIGIVDALCGVARWERFDARAEDWVRINPPRAVADILLSRVGMWAFPKVVGVITTPTIRPDGSILSAPGYDETTRLYHAADPSLVLSPAVHEPSRDIALKAVALLTGLLDEFPFVTEVGRAVALSGLITPVVRGALNVAPLHAFRANTAGSGKSFLVDLASAISSGRPCPVVSAGHTEEETEKRLAGLLLAGFPLGSIDNVNGELGGDLLCQAIERPFIRIRRLGGSDITEIESRATLFATGNNLRVRGDMVRRSLMGDLDAGMERPELRQFKGDPVATVMASRGRYVSACLAIVRAYIIAGCPDRLPPIASFEDWSGIVRSALVWLGCADPADSMEQAREDDPELSELREVTSLWQETFGTGDGFTVKELTDRADERTKTQIGEPTEFAHSDWRDCLIRIVGERGSISTRRFGNWLRDREGRIAAGLRLVKAGTAQGGVAKWALKGSSG
jgi:putative DNA primase/helicase